MNINYHILQLQIKNTNLHYARLIYRFGYHELTVPSSISAAFRLGLHFKIAVMAFTKIFRNQNFRIFALLWGRVYCGRRAT